MDAAGLIQAKQLARAATSEQITFTDLMLFSVARTVADFPQIVALDENSKQAAINVAFAVATPENNVVTPVLSGANVLSLAELGRRRRELTDLALSRSLRVKHLEGGQFTVSNLGMEGVDFFAPIINSPQRAILAVGRIAQIPVGVANVIELGWRMWANLAADHRYVDGAMAARFLSRWQENLQTLPEDLGK
jgi:pyruvate dehydrogenase E2 component (dihydrolipoamide acetyltransferase)